MLKVDLLPNQALKVPRQTIEIKCCHTFRRRLIGFIGGRSIAAHELLWLQPCAAVHTFGMRCPLALIFVDRDGRCLRIVEQANPNRVYGCRRAHGVIEMRSRAYAEVVWLWQAIAPLIRQR